MIGSALSHIIEAIDDERLDAGTPESPRERTRREAWETWERLLPGLESLGVSGAALIHPEDCRMHLDRWRRAVAPAQPWHPWTPEGRAVFDRLKPWRDAVADLSSAISLGSRAALERVWAVTCPSCGALSPRIGPEADCCEHCAEPCSVCGLPSSDGLHRDCEQPGGGGA